MAQEAASFKIEMFSTSKGFTAFNEPSIPSIITNGDAVFIVPTPRTRREVLSSPGIAEPDDACKPGLKPANAEETVVMGRDLVCSSKSTEATAPVRFTFFCTP